MQKLADRLRQVEDRLERLLASGWWNTRAEAAELADEANALVGLRQNELADGLRRVA